MTSAQSLTWVLETEVFADRHEGLREAASAQGQDVIAWDDIWWANGAWPKLSDRHVVFHGSLGNAAEIRRSLPWRPGAFCNTESFQCSSWYPQLPEGLLNRRHAFTTVQELCGAPERHFEALACGDAVFVRPDSALKPFSGRILKRSEVSPKALDHGFYYDDPGLPIVVAPTQAVAEEWRLIVVDGVAITGSAYDAEGRSGRHSEVPAEVRLYAEAAAKRIEVGDRIYAMDLCRTDDGLRVLELNPFSGADLYHCDRQLIVAAVGEMLSQTGEA